MVRTIPWPVRAPFSVVPVVPTTTQATPGTPSGVVVPPVVDVPVPWVDDVLVVLPSRQEMPSRLPIPAGTGSAVHVAPPSRVTSTVPATWLRSTVVRAAAQQCWKSVQEMDVAPETAAGRVPSCSHGELDPGETSAATPPGTVPKAVQRPSARQDTAVTSDIPAGTDCWVQAAPPSEVVMIAPSPLEL